MSIKRYDSRGGRKLAILETMYTLQRSLTMYEVADLLHLSRSNHLTKILLEMVASGDLAYYEAQHRPNSTKRLFYVPSITDAPKEQQRMAL